MARAPREAPRPTDGRPSYVATGERVTAVVDGVAVGVADAGRALRGRLPAAHDRGRPAAGGGAGSGPGSSSTRDGSPRSSGADEMVLVTGSDNAAVLPMVLGAGLRGRIRMAGGELTVRVPVRDLRPLRA